MSSESWLTGRERVVMAGLAATAGVAVATAVYYATKNTYEQYVPIQYQYRPGTISGWVSKALAKYSDRRRRRRPVRVYMDGCFDMMHYGHANALRQAKAFGDQLVVGLIPDSEILRCKGPPVMNEEERYDLVEAVKWVDEILTGVPYDLSPEFIAELFSKHRIDYILHGDDPCLLPDGTDAYAHAKRLGRFKMVKRTEGVSTTDIVGRMLTCSRGNTFIQADEHPLQRPFSIGHQHTDSDDDDGHPPSPPPAPLQLQPTPSNAAELAAAQAAATAAATAAGGGGSGLSVNTICVPAGSAAAASLVGESPRGVVAGSSGGVVSSERASSNASASTSAAASVAGSNSSAGNSSVSGSSASGSSAVVTPQKVDPRTTLSRFLPTSRRLVQFSNGRQPPEGARIVYIDGAFDCFHSGHVKILRLARAQGDFLLVGLHTDEAVGERRGPHLPIMNLHERSLSVLACKYVDEVIIGAPPVLSEDLIKTFNIDVVVRGTVSETGGASTSRSGGGAEEEDRYAVARQLGKFLELPSPSPMTARAIIHRIVHKRTEFEARNAKKVKSEEKYYTGDKQYVQEL